jgi:hypothetical protein
MHFACLPRGGVRRDWRIIGGKRNGGAWVGVGEWSGVYGWMWAVRDRV